eukprot:114146-Heterocapsa_arctica.AAC.1
MSRTDPWVAAHAAPSTAPPSEMHTSLAISGSEGQKTASAGSEGSGKPVYPIFGGPKSVKAAPALMGSGAADTGPVTDLDDATREYALEFLRSSGSDTGNPYGPEITSMRKRGPSANRRV